MLKELNLKTSGLEPSKNRLRFRLAKKRVACNVLSPRVPMKNLWTVDISTTGSDTHEAFQIEDDGSLMMKDGIVDVDFSKKLQKVLGAIQIRPAIVHVQDKGQQKVVAFYASPTLFPRIPGTFIDHKACKRIVHYKQPDVHTTEKNLHIYVKETKTDHHVGAHHKGLCQGARL